MPRRSERALASLLLVSRSVPSDEPLSAKEYWSLIERVEDPARLLGRDTDALDKLIGAKLAPRGAKLLNRATALALARRHRRSDLSWSSLVDQATGLNRKRTARDRI